jgi:uncharacterized protein
MEYLERSYRSLMGSGRFRGFAVAEAESDLWVGVDPGSYAASMEAFCLESIRRHRSSIKAYAAGHKGFYESMTPLPYDGGACAIVRAMLEAGQLAGVGPMAAVAGAMAEAVGRDLRAEFGPREIFVENGGDDWILFEREIAVAVFAGQSPLSLRVGVRVPPELSPIGICTSAGTVGPSFSAGLADAAMVACKGAALADACASAYGNRVRAKEDLERAASLEIEGVLAVLLVKDDAMALRGALPLATFSPTSS